MADVLAKGNKGPRRNIRIDLTPMVDLGFLLICFFMYTATLAKSKVMEINSPIPDYTHPTPWPEEATITLISVSAHKIIYYPGTLLKTAWRQIGYSGDNSI